MSRLPVLMYHNIVESDSMSKDLCISVGHLNEQLNYLKKNNYKTYYFSELKDKISNKETIDKKSVVITFDDCYLSQLELAYPLLIKYGLKASFFIPFSYINKRDHWNGGEKQLMTIDQLKSLDSDFIELGWHSFAHDNYKNISISESERDLELCNEYITKNDLKVEKVMAYPYGKYPKKGEAKEVFFKTMAEKQIYYGLRIGNRLNSFPFKNNYEIQRIDIKGEDSLARFKLKLKFGKLKLF